MTPSPPAAFMSRLSLPVALLAALGGAIEPLVVPPSQYWDGMDGSWSTFWMSAGTPPQTLRLLPSTTGNAVWPVLPQGCTPKDPGDCEDKRGQVFSPNKSSTWSDIGLYQLGLNEESPLGYRGNGSFGYDDVRLGVGDPSSPLLPHHIIEGFATKNFYLGTIGLSANAINISDLLNPSNSFLASLKEHELIPSLSWAYTAGASYAEPPAFGSLILGGLDTFRFEDRNVIFAFGPDINRELLVYLSSVRISTAETAVIQVGVYALLDSLVPDIWLPRDVCKKFQDAFGLQYNSTANRYFVNDSAHETNSKLNNNMSFVLSKGPSSEDNSTNITMPWKSFDLKDKTPAVGKGDEGAHYFPLRQAKNSSQHTIGRVFFQNAYVVADYERSTFSVNQAIFPSLDSNKENIVPILPKWIDDSGPSNTTSSGNHKPRKGVIAAVAAASGVVALATISTVAWVWHKSRQRRKQALISDNSSSEDHPCIPELIEQLDRCNGELSQDAARRRPELSVGEQPWRADLEVTPLGSRGELFGVEASYEASAECMINEAEGEVPVSELSSAGPQIHEMQTER